MTYFVPSLNDAEHNFTDDCKWIYDGQLDAHYDDNKIKIGHTFNNIFWYILLLSSATADSNKY